MLRILIILVVAFASACFNTSRFDTCADGERLAEVGGKEACFETCDGGCSGDTTCVQGVCISSELLLIEPNPNNNDADMGDPNVPDVSMFEAEQLCTDLADLLFGCSTNHCTLTAPTQQALDQQRELFINGDEEELGCIKSAQSSDPYVQSGQDLLANENCETTRAIRCDSFGLASQCDCTPPPTVGNTCDGDDACAGGDFFSGCFQSENNPQGLCISSCPDVEPQRMRDYILPNEEYCGAGNFCTVAVSEESRFGYCLRGCDAQEECDGDSACAIIGVDDQSNTYSRVCVPWAVCEDGSCQGKCNAQNICEISCATAAAITVCENSGGSCEEVGETTVCVLP